MTNSSKDLHSLIGRFRFGGSILIPYNLNVNTAEEFLGKFSLDDQVDLYCVTEFVRHQRYHDEHKGLDLFSINVVYVFLHEKSESDPLRTHLNQLKLFTSIDRVRQGQQLAI